MPTFIRRLFARQLVIATTEWGFFGFIALDLDMIRFIGEEISWIQQRHNVWSVYYTCDNTQVCLSKILYV